jgi:hypothetical protein
MASQHAEEDLISGAKRKRAPTQKGFCDLCREDIGVQGLANHRVACAQMGDFERSSRGSPAKKKARFVPKALMDHLGIGSGASILTVYA